VAESALRKEQQLKAWQAQQKLIDKTEDFIRRNMAGQKTIQAQSRLKMLNKLEVIDAPQAEKSMRISFQTEGRSGNDVFRLEDVSFGYPGKILAEHVNLYAGYKDRIAILGQNGCGKTTLLSLLRQEKQPQQGKVIAGASMKIGYYEQFHDLLNPSLTARETIRQMMPLAPQGEVLGYLARFGFRGDDVEKQVSSLSGGERARLNLARLILEKPNVLLLDEPTNHLDLSMTDSLEEALNDFSGTILFVSHDRYFIKKIATKTWLFRNNTIIDTEQELEAIFAQGFTEKPVKKEKAPQIEKVKVKKVNPWNLEQILKEIERLQAEIETLHAEKADIEYRFTLPETYKDADLVRQYKDRLDAIDIEVANIQDKILAKEEEYLELSC
jgi:ATP-binding cassette subfamily F protein 3